jgi:hypothetical protein
MIYLVFGDTFAWFSCYLPLFGVLIACFLVFGALSCIWSWKVVTTLVEVVNL